MPYLFNMIDDLKQKVLKQWTGKRFDSWIMVNSQIKQKLATILYFIDNKIALHVMLCIIYVLTLILISLPFADSHPQPLSRDQSKQQCTDYCTSCFKNSFLSKYQLATIFLLNQTTSFVSNISPSLWEKCLLKFYQEESKNKVYLEQQQLGTTSQSLISFELASDINIMMAWVICFCGFALQRLSGLELLIMIQIIWQTFMTYSKTMPEQYATTSGLKYSSGFFYYSKQPSTVNKLHLQAYNISSQYLTENFNFALLFYFVPLACASICKLLTFKQKFRKKASLKLQRMLQFTLYGTMINLGSFVTFSTIFYRFGEKTHIGSNIIFAFGACMTLGIFVAFYRQPDSFKKFRYSFKVGFYHFHYYYYSLSIIITMILLTIIDISWPCLIPFSILTIYTLLFQPYKTALQNIRSSFNLSVILFAITIRIVFPSATQNVLNILGIVLICALVPIAILLAIFDLLFHFILQCKDVEPKDFQYMLFNDNAAVEQMAIQENNRQKQNYESQKFKNESYRSINYNTNNVSQYGSRFYEELKMIKKQVKEKETQMIQKTHNEFKEIRQFSENQGENEPHPKDKKYWGVKNQSPHREQDEKRGKIEKEKIQQTSVIPQEDDDDDPQKIHKVMSEKQDNKTDIEKLKNEKYLQIVRLKKEAEDAQRLLIEQQKIRARKMEEEDRFLKLKNAQMLIKETDNNFIEQYNQI